MSAIGAELNFAAGISELDDQHARLVDLANELYRTMSQGEVGLAMGEVVAQLAAYTDTHFAWEEEHMALAQFPGLESHRQEHQTLRAKLAELREQVPSRNSLLGVRVVDFLGEWLFDHILRDDGAFGRFLAKSMLRAKANGLCGPCDPGALCAQVE